MFGKMYVLLNTQSTGNDENKYMFIISSFHLLIANQLGHL